MKSIITKLLEESGICFTEEDIQLGLSYFQKQDFSAGDCIVSMGDVCDVLFIAEASITRCFYVDHEGKEQTLWMKPEQQFITEYKSFTQGEASRFSLQFYESTTVMSISRNQLMELYQSSQAWALFGIWLMERVHVTLIDVFVNLLANDATANYRYIEYAFPRFLKVAPLKDIASMLQISPVSISRIRAGNQVKR